MRELIPTEGDLLPQKKVFRGLCKNKVVSKINGGGNTKVSQTI